jgi:hypothetical protein
MTHRITKCEGLGDKMFEIAYQAGEAFAIESQIVSLRKRAESLKLACSHPVDMQQTEHHEYTYPYGGKVTWTTKHCAYCNGLVRSVDTLLAPWEVK